MIFDDWRSEDVLYPTEEELNLGTQWANHAQAIGDYASEQSRLFETIDPCPSWCLESSKGKKRIRQITDAYLERQKRLKQS